MSANKHQDGAAHACESRRLRWNHQIADQTELFKKIHTGTTRVPEALDEPLTACNVRGTADTCKTACTDNTRDVVRSDELHGQHTVWPEWCQTCSSSPMITMGPSDGQSATTFQKWSLQGPCRRRMDHLQRIRPMDVETICMMWLTGLTRARRSAWLAHKAICTAETINAYDLAMCSGSL